jgi:hypothetical protein
MFALHPVLWVDILLRQQKRESLSFGGGLVPAGRHPSLSPRWLAESKHERLFLAHLADSK